MLLAGISTAVLEGGEGPPVVLLHGPMGNATHWMRIIPGLVATHRVIAPDLPGHGASEITAMADRCRPRHGMAGELIEQSCETPPVLVGQLLGGAIAARYASRTGHRLHRLVLVDTFGLRPFQPAPEFGLALSSFLAQPNERTTRTSGTTALSTWTRCANGWAKSGSRSKPTTSIVPARRAFRPRWHADGAVRGAGDSGADLARIKVPTTLIWGRHDRATPLSVAEEASARFGWPLHVIENCNDDPPVEQPEELLRALRVALDGA